MYNYQVSYKSQLKINDSAVGEPIEAKIRRIVNNKEPIKDTVQMLYTERKDGVLPAYNPRTDRWDLAIDAQDSIAAGRLAERATKMNIGEQAKEGMTKEGQNGGAESIDATTKQDGNK